MQETVDFIGNAAQVSGLRRALKQERSLAFLLHGPKHLGKRTIVEALARETLAATNLHAHPDMLLIQPDGEKSRATITVEQARSVRQFLSTSPFSADKKVVIIDGVETMSSSAANSLLKILEEPPGQALLFLLTADVGAVLPTVRSRSLPVRFAPVLNETIAKALSLSVDDDAVRLAHGRPGLAIRLHQDTSAREALMRRFIAAQKLLDASALVRLSYVARVQQEAPEAFYELPGQWLVALRDAMRSGDVSGQNFTRALLSIMGIIRKTNARPELLLETALLAIPAVSLRP